MRILRRKTSTPIGCNACKEAVGSSKIYCSRLKEYVDDIVYCPYFEPKILAVETKIS